MSIQGGKAAAAIAPRYFVIERMLARGRSTLSNPAAQRSCQWLGRSRQLARSMTSARAELFQIGGPPMAAVELEEAMT